MSERRRADTEEFRAFVLARWPLTASGRPGSSVEFLAEDGSVVATTRVLVGGDLATGVPGS